LKPTRTSRIYKSFIASRCGEPKTQYQVGRRLPQVGNPLACTPLVIFMKIAPPKLERKEHGRTFCFRINAMDEVDTQKAYTICHPETPFDICHFSILYITAV